MADKRQRRDNYIEVTYETLVIISRIPEGKDTGFSSFFQKLTSIHTDILQGL
jgi:hypothetical protein